MRICRSAHRFYFQIKFWNDWTINPDLLSEAVLQKKKLCKRYNRKFKLSHVEIFEYPLPFIGNYFSNDVSKLNREFKLSHEKFLNIPFNFLEILTFSNDVLKIKSLIERNCHMKYFLTISFLFLENIDFFKWWKRNRDLKLSLEGIFDYFLPILGKYWLFHLMY